MDSIFYVNRIDLGPEKKVLSKGKQESSAEGGLPEHMLRLSSSMGPFSQKTLHMCSALVANRASSNLNEISLSLSPSLTSGPLVAMENGQMKPRKNLKENLTKLKL